MRISEKGFAQLLEKARADVGLYDYAKSYASTFALVVCIKRQTSTLAAKRRGVIYKTVGSIAGCSAETARRHLKVAESLKLVELCKNNGKYYLHINKLKAHKIRNKKTGWYRSRKRDIILNNANTDFSSYKSVEVALMSLLIVRKQSHRDFLCQQDETSRGIGIRADHKGRVAMRNALNRLHRYNVESYTDYGMSRGYLRRNLTIGQRKLKNVIDYGEELGMFIRKKCVLEFRRIGEAMSQNLPKFIDFDNSCRVFCTRNYMVRVIEPSSFILPDSKGSFPSSLLSGSIAM